jgi:hypothetical protein
VSNTVSAIASKFILKMNYDLQEDISKIPVGVSAARKYRIGDEIDFQELMPHIKRVENTLRDSKYEDLTNEDYVDSQGSELRREGLINREINACKSRKGLIENHVMNLLKLNISPELKETIMEETALSYADYRKQEQIRGDIEKYRTLTMAAINSSLKRRANRPKMNADDRRARASRQVEQQIQRFAPVD